MAAPPKPSPGRSPWGRGACPLFLTRYRAFSMIELLIALVMIALAMFPIMSVLSASHGDSRTTMEEVLASNLASELVEAVQTLPFELIPQNVDAEVAQGTFAQAAAAGYRIGLASPPVGFKRFLKTETLAVESAVPAGLSLGVQERAASAAAILKIRVRIEWSSRGRPETLQLVTARGGF